MADDERGGFFGGSGFSWIWIIIIIVIVILLFFPGIFGSGGFGRYND